ncbi:MAG: NADH-quinone oxidoreductase subunit N [Acidimicrobiia bacterium]
MSQVADRISSPEIDWFALSPMLTLLGGALVMLVASVLVPQMARRGWNAFLTVSIASAAVVLAFVNWNDVQDHGPKSLVRGAVALDGFSIFVTIAICASVIGAALLFDDYLRREEMDGAELYALLLLAATGGIVMASANDLIVLFLGVETLSIALYIMAGSQLRRIESQESAIKYFVLGGFASAFLLYGIALTYGATGSTSMVRIAETLAGNVILKDNAGLFYAGMALMMVGLAFKVAAVPFHTWTPDVYQGAPSPVTAFMASAAKAAGFAAMLRVFYLMYNTYSVDWKPIVWVLAVLTLAVGSIMAVSQTNVKRMLAYSSVSHAGFILVGVQAASAEGTSASLFYVLAYTFMVVGTFGVITIAGGLGDHDHSLDAYRGLARRRPVLAFVFTIFLLAQAGVPLTSGFIAKFQVIKAAVDTEGYALALVAMIAAVVAAFLYLRIVVSMYLTDAEAGDDDRAKIALPISGSLALTLAVAFTLFVGFYPTWVIDFARDAVPVLVASK